MSLFNTLSDLSENFGGMRIGNLSFDKFTDPRFTLRFKNNASITLDLGKNSLKPVPVTRGGIVSTKSTVERKQRQMGSQGLFEDPDFPTEDSSVYYSQRPPKPIKWLRPHEICSNPKFIDEGASRFDVLQGEMGDCWLLAAVACLSTKPNLFKKVVPIDQSFDKNYTGLFKFHFWHYGVWTEVEIDDRLPTNNGMLLFMHSSSRNEFWSALLEKAYAKLYGSYESLRGGLTTEALVDFTGGVGEHYELRKNLPDNLWAIMCKSHKHDSLMGCSISADPSKLEAVLPNGLVMGHAYSITAVQTVNGTQLLRIRNPWGTVEWKGDWSDNSNEWRSLSNSDRTQLGLVFDDDGEFWMSLDDFISNFTSFEICHLHPGCYDDGTMTNKTKWECSTLKGGWSKHVSAGGCINNRNTFWTNPQYRLEVTDADDDDEEQKGTVIVGLMQVGRRKLRSIGAELLTIGYTIYKIPEQMQGNSETLDANFFRYNRAKVTSTYINLREVSGRHVLDVGEYVVIPTTFSANMDGEFLVRIFSEKPNRTKESDDSPGITVTPDQPDANFKPTPLSDPQKQALSQAFAKVSGADGVVSNEELRDILNAMFSQDTKNFKFNGFSLESCRSMLSMMDIDRSGKMDKEEFFELWINLQTWKSIFTKFDENKNGTIQMYELRSALKSMGLKISNELFAALGRRFSRSDGSLHFDDFVVCCSRLKYLKDIFDGSRKNNKDEAVFSEAEFLLSNVYL